MSSILSGGRKRRRRLRTFASTALRTAAVAIAVLVAGAAFWLVGVVAVGQALEDVCLDDLNSRTQYGASQSDGSLWPPALECRLLGSDVEPIVVQHRLEAAARFGAIVVFPVVYGLSVATLALTRWSRSRTASRTAPT